MLESQILFILFFFSLLSMAFWSLIYGEDSANNISFLYSVFVLCAIATFRNVGFGSDDEAYVEIFKKIAESGNGLASIFEYRYSDYNVEFLFFLLLKIILLLGSDSIFLFFVVSFLAVAFNLKAIKELSPFFLVSVLVYFSHFYLAKELNAIRVGLASALVFFSAKELYYKKYFKSFLFWLVSLGVHITALLSIIPIVLYFIHPSKRTLIFITVLLLFVSPWLNIKDIMWTLSGWGEYGEKLKLYLNADMYSYQIPLWDVVNIKNLFFVVVCLFYWDALNAKFPTFYFSFMYFFSAFAFRVFFGSFAILSGRGYSVISMFEYIIIPFAFSVLFGKGGVVVVVMYALLTLLMDFNFNTSWSGGIPF
ncbi:EpsG family protein [Aeromonas jandaei]|uniref:EpsG family protein n=1 Tax=Aeromonas jandaei TaxID=650 RepID=UPI003EC4E97E